MAQATVRLFSKAERERAAVWCWNAEPGTVVTFATPDKRTLDQNALMWALLTEIAGQVEWHGQRLAPDDWKQLFLAGMDRGVRMVPALDGRGFVNLNTSSSALRVREFASLLDDIHRFIAENDVVVGSP